MKQLALYPILAALFVAEVSAAFETAMIYASMRALIEEFGDPIAVGWLVTVYGLVAAGVAAVAGRIGDLFGRRKIILILLFLAASGSALSASTDIFGVVLLGRGMQGLAAAVLPLSFGIVRQEFPQKFVPIAIGILISAASAGIASGLVLGGVIVDHYSWRAVFFAGAALGYISLLAVIFFVPKSKTVEVPEKLDLWGGMLFIPAIASLLFALTKSKDWGWTDLRIISFFIVGLVLMNIWIRHSLRHPTPLLNVRLFANRNITVVYIIALFLSLSGQQVTLVVAMLLQSPTWTGVGLGVTATVAGLVKLPSNIGSLFAGPLSGWIASKYNHRYSMYLGGIMMTLGWLALTLTHGNIYVIGAILMFISFGTTALFAATPTVIVEAVPHDRTSEATGMLVVMRSAFQAIGSQVIAIVMATSTISNPEMGEGSFPTPFAMTLTLGLVTLCSAMSIVTALLLPKYKAGGPVPESSKAFQPNETTGQTSSAGGLPSNIPAEVMAANATDDGETLSPLADIPTSQRLDSQLDAAPDNQSSGGIVDQGATSPKPPKV